MLADNELLRNIVFAGAVIAALSALWRQGLRPMLRGAREFGRSATTLAAIAEQFKPNHGSSLVDRLTAIEVELSAVRTMSNEALLQHEELERKVEEVIRCLETPN